MIETAKPVAVAVIGAGRMGSLYSQLANELALTRLIAICSDHPENTLRVAEALGVPGYSGCRYEEMLDRHPEIEAVVVSTPEWVHFAPVMASLRAGKHVLVEKPLAISPAEAWEMTAAAHDLKRTLMVCHSLRFNPRFAIMKETVAKGEIGNVVHMYARRNSLQPAVDRVLGRFPLAYWLAPHDIDMMMWTTGSPAVSVHARSKAGGADRTDFLIANLRFENGALGVLESSWCTPGFAGRPLNELFTVRGDAGMIEVVGHEQGLAVYTGHHTVTYPDTCHAPVIHGQTEGPYRSLLRHFAGAVRKLWPPLMSGADAAAVIDVAFALQKSLETGREIAVESRNRAAAPA